MVRTILAAALAAALAAGCAPGKRDLLTAGTWTCDVQGELRISLTFARDGGLTGRIETIAAATPEPDAISLKLELTGGHWSLAGDSDLTFRFDDAKMIEARRGSQPLDPAEAEVFGASLSMKDDIPARISELTPTALVLTPKDKDDPLSCKR